VQNSNDSSWMTNPQQPLVGYPALVSEDSISLSERTRYGLSQIAARLSGSDGKPGKRFNTKHLQEMLLSQQSQGAVNLLADLKQACVGAGSVDLPQEGGTVDIGKGCLVLASWDGKADTSSVGWPLFEEWLSVLTESQLDFWLVPFDKKDPVNTPRGLRLDDADIKLGVRQALGAAMKSLDAQGLDYSKPWGQIQVAHRGAMRIPIGGGNRSSNDIYNSMLGVPSLTHPGQLEPYFGSSIVLTVSFEGGSPKAQGFLTFSQSTNPDSPHFADQTERFSKKEWITYPFTEAEIKADPKFSSKTISQ
jgi:acyl-homoserine-lactone acylase